MIDLPVIANCFNTILVPKATNEDTDQMPFLPCKSLTIMSLLCKLAEADVLSVGSCEYCNC